ncbi:kinase [Parabacteroides sp. An277]|uniref:putative LPS assembly protein LptD n=1 Tax=Parabacteroides sp. An277 TaxID=1965619 RepID=UPI000B391690|nr:putative LPS assembly protein LptD [Parabacteroides sp. An277]OUO55569.1 kinase [Parabacteroides sp. An277]
MKYRILLTLFVYVIGSWWLRAQEVTPPTHTDAGAVTDTTLPPAIAAPDTLPTDTLAADTTRKGALEAPVAYQATDSIVMTSTNMAFLYGEGDVKYQQIQLQAEEIQMSMDSSTVFAKFGLDSIGEEFGYPLFIDGGDQYESKTMRYNFKTKKGYITDVITQQGEGYVTAGRTKKTETDALNMVGGRYTTCDDHEHPHFYIQMTKAKVRPKKNIVTGPVYMVFEDVPIYPLGLPFCFFPFSDTYSSGILMPTFGDESARGFYLRDGGYYFAINDYIDLALTGEIYTKGSWGLSAKSSYRKRYKYSGNFLVSYLVSKYGDKGLPDYSVSKDFKVNWTHTQDSKANPYLSFSASVNFATSSYDRNQLNGLYNPESTSNTKGSTVNITKRFPNSPLSISGTMSINQTTRDSSIAVTLPDLTVTLSRIYPFKRKQAVGKERWYEKISMSYTGYFRNSISTKENLLFKSNLIKDWTNGMQHRIPVSATFTAFKYLNISPSFNYTENWYTHKIEQAYDRQLGRMAPTDTTYGFYRTYEYDASISASTTLYGFFKPLPFFGGKKIEMIRHRFEPSISLSARPDFGASKFGFWENYVYTNDRGEQVETYYSPFSGQLFSPPSRGKSGSVNFSLNNNLEMKVKSDKDSTGFKKISLIDKLSLSQSYNMAADSFKWSDLSIGLRLKLSKNYTLNLNGTFDNYLYTYDEETRTARQIDKLRWGSGKFPRLRSTGTSFSYTFNNDTFRKWFGGGDEESGQQENTDASSEENNNLTGPQDEEGKKGERLLGKKKETGEYDADGYLKGEIPWSLSFNYSMSLGYGTFNPNKMEYNYRITHALSFNGNIQPTKNWRFNFNATYDFDTHKISYLTCNITRDLHCFQMSASFIPVGPYKSYTFSIAVSSSLLKDLKYNQSSSYREGQQWY